VTRVECLVEGLGVKPAVGVRPYAPGIGDMRPVRYEDREGGRRRLRRWRNVAMSRRRAAVEAVAMAAISTGRHLQREEGPCREARKEKA